MVKKNEKAEGFCEKREENFRNSLLDLEALDVEDQGGVGWDAREGLGAVGEVGGNGDSALTTDGHAGDTNVPTLDDLASAELEGERLALLVAVKDLAVLLELANVAHADAVATLGCWAGAELLVVNGHAVDDLDTEGTLGLLGGGSLGWSRRAGRALLEVLGELDALLVG